MQSELINTAIDDHVFPGCALAIVSPDTVECHVFGHQTYHSNSPLITPDTMYDIASITKSIPTTCLALHLIEVAEMSLTDTVDHYLPQTKGLAVGSLTIKNLLTFLPDFKTSMAQLKDFAAEEILHRVLNMDWQVSQSITPNNAVSIILTLILNAVTGKNLPQCADEIFFQPLNMASTTFFPAQFPLVGIAPAEIDEWRQGLVHGEVHDESAWKLRSQLVVGSAGLFSTVSNLAIFVQMLLHEGSWQGKQYFQPATIKQMATNQLTEYSLSAGLGWELQQPWMGQSCSDHTFGKTGFTGCWVAIDPLQAKGMVFLSNVVHPHRPLDRSTFNLFRQQICDIIFSPQY